MINQKYGVAIRLRNYNNFVVETHTLTDDHTTAVLELKNISSIAPDIYDFAIVTKNKYGYKIDRESIVPGNIPLYDYQVESVPVEEIILN